jgi:hypothetical protein
LLPYIMIALLDYGNYTMYSQLRFSNKPITSSSTMAQLKQLQH